MKFRKLLVGISLGLFLVTASFANAPIVEPPTIFRSHFFFVPMPINVLVVADGDINFDKSTAVSFEPEMIVLPVICYVVSDNELWLLVLVMPLWVAEEVPEVLMSFTPGGLTIPLVITMLPF